LEEFDLYINAKKPAVGLYVRKGVGLPDLADKNDWLFANVAFEGDLPQNIVQEINKNGHAFRDMD
jgi:hypothetical protein